MEASFYIYRKPKDTSFKGGLGYSVNSLEPGFIISPFTNDADSIFTIKKEKDLPISALNQIAQNIDFASPALYSFPKHSTSKEEYLSRLDRIIKDLNPGEKTVFCRVVTGSGEIDLESTLIELSIAFPKAMVFCFYTPASGLWFGASPEKLLSIKGNQFATMALAGTRPIETKLPWDDKNREEQQLVVDYISEVLLNNNLPFIKDATFTAQAGPIEHLCTRFSGPLPHVFDETNLRSLLLTLSPTPALCGLPKDKSMELIHQTEDFERGYYGGFCGELTEKGECDFYVILRSIRIVGDQWCMFAGGGITSSSLPLEEWTETERKYNAIVSHLVRN